mmetsp:Transcript_55841/g.147626  ORF Transcript_55841/g.147626 Transcript_55841/m.147626 type:complete len:202 (-) Transcript_55841:44-649(-)
MHYLLVSVLHCIHLSGPESHVLRHRPRVRATPARNPQRQRPILPRLLPRRPRRRRRLPGLRPGQPLLARRLPPPRLLRRRGAARRGHRLHAHPLLRRLPLARARGARGRAAQRPPAVHRPRLLPPHAARGLRPLPGAGRRRGPLLPSRRLPRRRPPPPPPCPPRPLRPLQARPLLLLLLLALLPAPPRLALLRRGGRRPLN